MASFKKLFVLGLILFCPLGLAAQESVQLLWTARTIDPAPVLEFAQMNDNEIVATLRVKYKLKIIIFII